MKLAVGFITYNDNSAKYLPDFLSSLRTALDFLKKNEYKVYAFDNSVGNLINRNIINTFIDSEFNVELLYQDANLGFGRAYNVLIKRALAEGFEYFLIINPDTILDKSAISELLSVLEKNGDLASVAPKILRWDFINKQKTETIDSLGLVLGAGLKFSDFGQGEKDLEGQKEILIIGPSGAAGMFRLNALEKVAEKRGDQKVEQYFDERLFMYKEDCDLAYRLFLMGFKSKLVDSAVIYHDRTAAIHGQRTKAFFKTRRSKSRQIRAWSFRNQHLIFIKHWKYQSFGNRLLIIFRCLSLLIFSLIFEQFLLREYLIIFRLLNH